MDKFDFLQIKKEYIFSEGSIKPARFRDQIKHQYQINMDDKCGKIEPVVAGEIKKVVKAIEEKPVYSCVTQVP